MMTSAPADATPRPAPSLRASVALNVAAQAVPVLFAAGSIPLLTRGLGADRFGILILGWTFFGTVGIFDLGLSRSLTQVVAQHRTGTDPKRIAGLVWVSLAATLLLGAVGAALLAATSDPLVTSFLKVPERLRAEARNAILLLALAIPVVLSANTLRGMLEAFGRFDYATRVRVPVGAATFLAPVGVLFFTPRVDWSLAAMLASRVLGWAGFAGFCLRTVPTLVRPAVPEPAHLRTLFHLGGWMTVSNVVSPVLVYFDRLLIGAMLSMQAVAFYATPSELATRLLALPVAVGGVFFPSFAATHAVRPERLERLSSSAVRLTLLGVVPPLLVCVAMAHPILAVWAGAEFAVDGTAVLRFLSVGVLCNALAQVPFSLVHGAGRPDSAARLHLLEAPLYLAALVWALPRFGLAGAAAVWSLRTAFDAVGLFLISSRLAPATRPSLRFVRNATGFSLGLLGLTWGLAHAGAPVIGLSLSVTSFAVTAWLHILRPEWRRTILRWLPSANATT